MLQGRAASCHVHGFHGLRSYLQIFVRTIVAFGDSWTSNGSNGTIPFAPVVFPPNPSAGARIGNNERARASNGYTWIEDLANTIGAKLVNVGLI